MQDTASGISLALLTERATYLLRIGIAAAAFVLVGNSVEPLAQTGTGSVESQVQANTGSINLHLVTAGFIVSTGSGTGTLSYQGKEYPLSVADVSLGTIGVSGVELVGTVYNLRTVVDIAGRYTSVGAELTIGAGAEMGRFGNANGVVLELAGLQLGLALGVGSAGMTIALQQ
jgi:hypothetical protein